MYTKVPEKKWGFQVWVRDGMSYGHETSNKVCSYMPLRSGKILAKSSSACKNLHWDAEKNATSFNNIESIYTYCTWGILKVKFEVDFRSQKFFHMILISRTIFWPTFKIPSRKGKNLGILTPSNELFFQKSHTCNFEKFIWGTYRWAIKMMFGSFLRA